MDSNLDSTKLIELKDIIVLLIGGFIGYLISLFFFLKSKNSSNEKNLDRIFNLYEKTLHKSSNNDTMDEVKKEIGTKNKLDDIHNELVKIKSDLISSTTPSDKDVIRYKLLGDIWSTEYLKTINPKILTSKGYVYFSNILEFHKSIFPTDFPWAGKFRHDDVIITNQFGTVLPSKTQGTVDYTVKPVRSDQIIERMEDYCNKWNTNLNTYLHTDKTEKVRTVALYHHEFQVIHPFLDGNGRVGRILLNDMLEFLLNVKINLNHQRDEYYAALRFADMGDIEKLTNIIIEKIG